MALAEEKRANTRAVTVLERENATLQQKLEALEAQLVNAPSQAALDKMRRELRILKRLEYNEETVEEPEIAGEDDDLESVLVGKLKRVESELVTERVNRQELSNKIEQLEQSVKKADQAKETAEKLVASLEKDLAQAISTPISSDNISVPSTPMVIPGGDAATLQNVLDPNAPPPPEGTPATPQTSRSVSASEKAQDDHSVATIVMAQRDRLRARCESLEAERDSFKRELQAQVQASESLKTDNTKLYEKVRYLQSYSNKGGARRPVGDRDLDLEALEQRYEASVDPFRQFSKAERQRKLSEMSPMERTVFIVAKTVLATKEMRTGLFFYVLVLHLLVFSTTYHWSHADAGCNTMNLEHLAHLPPNHPDHIQQDLGSGH